VSVIINSCFKSTFVSLDIILRFHLAEIRPDYMYVLTHVRKLSRDSTGQVRGAGQMWLWEIEFLSKTVHVTESKGKICPVRALKEYTRSGGATPLILKLGIRWGSVVRTILCSFTSGKLPPPPPRAECVRLGGSRSRCGEFRDLL